MVFLQSTWKTVTLSPSQAINERLPCLARQKNDALIETTQGATSRLELVPTSTIEFVESLTFLDEIQEKVSSEKTAPFTNRGTDSI